MLSIVRYSKLVFPDKKVEFSCEIYGYPVSTVNWTFIQCKFASNDERSCDHTKTIIFSVSSPLSSNKITIQFEFFRKMQKMSKTSKNR